MNGKDKSVHLENYPKADKKLIDKKLEEEMEMTRNIVSTALRERDRAHIGLKWPLSKATVESPIKPSKELNEVIKEEPGMADAYYYRGQAFTELNKSKEAHDDFIKAAEIFQFGKNYNKAISSYNFAIEADKNSKTAYLGRAKLYLSKGEPMAAIPDFDKVLKLDKRNFDAYYGLGEASFNQQRYKTAINHFKDARSIDKNNPLVHQYLMLSYMAVDDYNNVKKSFEKFKNVSSDEEMQKFINNRKYSAVLKIIDLQ